MLRTAQYVHLPSVHAKKPKRMRTLIRLDRCSARVTLRHLAARRALGEEPTSSGPASSHQLVRTRRVGSELDVAQGERERDSWKARSASGPRRSPYRPRTRPASADDVRSRQLLRFAA